jgi:C-3',4' desaturase CrtD
VETDPVYDLIVVGGGIGGLTTAALAQHLGLRTALLEAHTRLGGCAGYFQRGPYTFDAGATALVGLRPGEPLGDLLNVVGLDLERVETPSYRVHLPDRTFDIIPEAEMFEVKAKASFATSWRSAHAQRTFWRLQATVGNTLLHVAGKIPRLPVRDPGDLVQVLGVLGVRGALAASTSILTVDHVLRVLGLKSDRAFRSLIAALLQDTAQAGPETVPFANAAAYLQAYRLGMSRPSGGMKALAEGIGQRFASRGGDLRTATLVDRIEIDPAAESGPGSKPKFVVVTRRRQRLCASQVALNMPLDLATRLLGRPLEGRLGRQERRSRAAWSAFTGYLAIDRSAVADDSPLFHQVLRTYDPPIHDGNNVLISLSPSGDEAYGPAHVRVVTLSTHTRPADWQGLDRLAYQSQKADFQARMLAALGPALPGAPEALVHAEFASPRSFQRYTRRTAGGVGGPPVSRSNSNLLAVSPDAFGRGIWLVGDSVFPGQGTLATVLSGIRVVERITGRSWPSIKHDRLLAEAGNDQGAGQVRDLSACRAIRQPQP